MVLVVVSLDANNGIFPTAVMVSMEESHDTWGFLDALTNYLGDDHPFKITFMSDRQKGLIHAVKDKCPNGYQRHCARHLHANFRKNTLESDYCICFGRQLNHMMNGILRIIWKNLTWLILHHTNG